MAQAKIIHINQVDIDEEGSPIMSSHDDTQEDMLARMAEHVEVTFEEVDISLLNVDDGEDGYQRIVDMDRVEAMIRSLNPLLMDPIVASIRDDGSYWVVDGHHRLSMYRKLRFKRVWCRLVYGLSREEEAQLFIAMAKGRKSISPYATHRAKLVARDEHAMAIETILTAEGYRLVEAKTRPALEIVPDKPFPIAAVDAVNAVYNMDNGKTLRECLVLIRRVWPTTDPDVATERFSLMGLGRFLSRTDGKVDRKRLDTVLGRTSPTVIKSQGEQWSAVEKEVTRPIGYAIAIIGVYNKGLAYDDRRIPVEVVM